MFNLKTEKMKTEIELLNEVKKVLEEILSKLDVENHNYFRDDNILGYDIKLKSKLRIRIYNDTAFEIMRVDVHDSTPKIEEVSADVNVLQTIFTKHNVLN
jgi:hypothetical protein